MASYPPSPEQRPDYHYESGRYRICFAANAEELDEILRLRYEVFNVEMGEGLEASEATGLDRDVFDAHCHHLMIVEKKSGAIVGTYRLQTAEMAEAGIGFYTGGEFDLSLMPGEVRSHAAETGRACIHRDHRNGRVLFLLWRGLIAYLNYNSKRYVFGCCSLTSQDPEEGLVVYDYLKMHGHLHPEWSLPPNPEYACEIHDGMLRTFPEPKIPQLMKIYLAYSAKICSPPAIDREFKTLDYLTLVDITRLDEKTYRNLVD